MESNIVPFDLFEGFFVVACGKAARFAVINEYGGTVENDCTDENQDFVTHTIFSPAISEEYFAWAYERKIPTVDASYFNDCMVKGKIESVYKHMNWLHEVRTKRIKNATAKRYFVWFAQKRKQYLDSLKNEENENVEEKGRERKRRKTEHTEPAREILENKHQPLPSDKTFNPETHRPSWVDTDEFAEFLDHWYIKATENTILDPITSYRHKNVENHFREGDHKEYFPDYMALISNLTLELLKNHKEKILTYSVFQESKLADALQTMQVNIDSAYVYFYGVVEAVRELMREHMTGTKIHQQIKIYSMIIDKMASLFKGYKTDNAKAIQMPEAYRNNRIIPQPDTIITQNRCPLVIAEYQSTIIDDHSIEKILVEMKLYSDACMEKKYIIAENFRTLGIIFSPKQLHLYVMQPHFVNVNNSVEKVYHEVYKVNVGDSRNLRDISQCIAILLFHLYEDGTDYTEVDTSGSIPRQNHKIKANEKTKPRETEDEIDAYTKTARWRRTKDNLPIEVYVLQKVLNNKHFVQIKNWKGLDTRYQVTMEKLRPLRFVKKSTRRKLSYMKNILSAIKILHSMKIIHGDVKTKNCMIREADGSAVLIDFDLCKIMTAPKMPLDKFENSFGTLGYIAPELEKREEYNELIDIYSCGIMFGEWIFENEYHRQEYEAKTDLLDDIERHRQSGIAEILKVIENMIADANTRISAEEALDRLCKIEDVI